ncbi:transcriptional regulator of the polyamine metabolism genes [Escherichia coli]|nr:transcriptional regulator of the polyamine metabolism genes [Escherichia coli]
MVCHFSEFFSEPEKPDEPQVVINQDDLIEMGSQGVSMKLVHNGNPNRTLAMIFGNVPAGHNHWGKN